MSNLLNRAAAAPRHGHHLLFVAEGYAANMTGDRYDASSRLQPRQGRWWMVAGSILAAFALGCLALDVSDWIRLTRGGGLLALVEGLYLAVGTVLILRLTVSAVIHGWHSNPKPDPWHDVFFGPWRAKHPRPRTARRTPEL